MGWLAIVVGVAVGLAVVWWASTSPAMCRYVEHDYEGSVDAGGITWRCRRCSVEHRAGRG